MQIIEKTIIKYKLRESTRFVNKAAKISVLLICKGRFTSSHNKIYINIDQVNIRDVTNQLI